MFSQSDIDIEMLIKFYGVDNGKVIVQLYNNERWSLLSMKHEC